MTYLPQPSAPPSAPHSHAAAPAGASSAPPPSGPAPGTHSSWVWPARIVGVLFVTLIVALGTTSVITEFFVREQSTTRTFTEPVSTLDASVEVGRITVTAGSGPDLTQVSAVTTSAFRTATVQIELNDGLLSLAGECGGQWFMDSRCAVDLDIVISPGTTLRLHSGTGDIVVVGADRDVSVSTATGDVRLGGLRSTTVDAEAATGDVDLRFVAPPTSVRARTATGDVNVRVPADGTAYRVDARADVGQPRVTVPRDAGSTRSIDVSSAVGDVTVATTP